MEITISNTHEAVGLTKLCDFRIESNSVMIKALTSRLYSDPVSSIVRELASNALDACPHRSMEISLPSTLTPHFSITDYGPGLSLADLTDIFTRFGASTKRNTNTQIGGFGLGAKSPFAYTNSFTIINRHGGTATTYIASIGTDGMPGLHSVLSTPTNETGITITVPVSSAFYQWKDALKQLEFFEPRPIVNGEKMPEPDILFSHDDYMVLRGGDPAVMVGPVRYPLSVIRAAFPSPIPPVVLQFPIGGIEVTASREEIVYSTATCTAIREKLTRAVASYRDHLQVIYDNCKTVPEIWRAMESDIFDRRYTFKCPLPNAPQCTVDVHRGGMHFHYGTYEFVANSPGKRKRWSTDFSRTRISRNTHYFLVDDPRKWQQRIETYANAKSIHPNSIACIPQVSADILSALGIPYVAVSSLPYTGSSRKAPTPIKFRVLSHRDKLIPTDATYNYYIKVDPAMYIINSVDPDRSPKLSHTLWYQLCRIVGNCYVIPPNFKGNYQHLQDAIPLIYTSIRDALKTCKQSGTNYAAIEAVFGSSRAKVYEGLGLLPPLVKDNTILTKLPTDVVLQFISEAEYDAHITSDSTWQVEKDRILDTFPQLSLLYETLVERNHVSNWVELLTPYVQKRIAETNFIPSI